jgi:predicted small metal-binding protein
MTQRVECIVDGCTGICEGETEGEVMAEVEAHVQDAHPDLTLDEDTVEAVRAEIETV